ncbi:uncharacterized protein [Callorhinus ursinus]|uniref:uncharacterized protein n=1 Tax=Callorhinus ursinus TaxID=34884 RepID=UPI003CD008F4
MPRPCLVPGASRRDRGWLRRPGLARGPQRARPRAERPSAATCGARTAWCGARTHKERAAGAAAAGGGAQSRELGQRTSRPPNAATRVSRALARRLRRCPCSWTALRSAPGRPDAGRRPPELRGTPRARSPPSAGCLPGPAAVPTGEGRVAAPAMCCINTTGKDW